MSVQTVRLHMHPQIYYFLFKHRRQKGTSHLHARKSNYNEQIHVNE